VFYEVVAIARDWSILLLVLEGILLCALPLFIALKCVQAMQKFLPQVRPALKRAQEAVAGVLASVDSVLAAIRRPFVWLEGAQAGLRGFQRSLKRS
jgi:hypothetical protein